MRLSDLWPDLNQGSPFFLGGGATWLQKLSPSAPYLIKSTIQNSKTEDNATIKFKTATNNGTFLQNSIKTIQFD